MKLSIGDRFVIGIALLSLGASIFYFTSGDWKRGIYWGCIVVINMLTIFLR